MKFAIRIAALLVLAGGAALFVARRPDLPAAERGRRLAERTGCFACHGPGGVRGAANHGRLDRTVPTFEGDVMMYAKTRAEVREWIADGVPARRARSETWRTERERGALRMPAFGRRLGAGEIDDLVEFVLASAGSPAPADSLAARGLARAEALGCTGCHGAGGRFARPNPGSFKGVVPSWDGADFADLVRDRAEFDAWVKDGVSRRLASNPLARYFLRRAALHMPRFERHLEPGDLDALWAYVTWLRSPAGRLADAQPIASSPGASE